MSPRDARSAVDAGVDGIVLSNHGGRQLDHSPAPLDMVASVRRAIGTRVPLLMDGGIRRGTDVLKVGYSHLQALVALVYSACHCALWHDTEAAVSVCMVPPNLVRLCG